jgi:TRAP-type mannitol/chloroaromatic compound transport system permease small subunit|tara:strand:- start:1601 stop:1867 length:267 start_codon:yes stop_codon:yes gene_type:complete
MELTLLKIIAAAWLSTWLVVQFRIFVPSIMTLNRYAEGHNSVKWWPITWLIFGVGTLITAPLLITTVLWDDHRDLFVRTYVMNLVEKQ